MNLTCPDFLNGQTLPIDSTADGRGVNPSLIISEVPADAKSLVLICEDPDAVGGTFVHWTVWNIDPATKEIPANSVPPGAVEGLTGYGTTGYGPAAPPPGTGTHRYIFTLYALSEKITLDSKNASENLIHKIAPYILNITELIGGYSR